MCTACFRDTYTCRHTRALGLVLWRSTLCTLWQTLPRCGLWLPPHRTRVQAPTAQAVQVEQGTLPGRSKAKCLSSSRVGMLWF